MKRFKWMLTVLAASLVLLIGVGEVLPRFCLEHNTLDYCWLQPDEPDGPGRGFE